MNQGIKINNNHKNTSQLYDQSGKAINKFIYAFCAIFFGSLGVHKFIAGKIGLGILYLVFCWTGIPAIVGVVEGIISLFKPSDASGNIVV